MLMSACVAIDSTDPKRFFLLNEIKTRFLNLISATCIVFFRSGNRITVSMMPGVGIGKELIDATMEVFACCGAPISPEWLTEHDTEKDLESLKLSIRRNGVGIKGESVFRAPQTISDDQFSTFRAIVTNFRHKFQVTSKDGRRWTLLQQMKSLKTFCCWRRWTFLQMSPS